MRIWKSKGRIVLLCIFLLSACLALYGFSDQEREFPADYPVTANTLQGNTTIHYIGHPGCSACIEARIEVDIFLSNHPEFSFIYYDVSNTTEYNMAVAFMQSEDLYWPTVVIEIGLCKYLINGQHITAQILEEVHFQIINNPSSCQEWTYYQEFRYWIAFVTGLLSGVSPCIILITGVFGASLIANRSRKYFISSLIGFSMGVLLMYFLIGFSFTFFINGALRIFSSLAMKLILGIPLILLGLWQCIDAWNEDSRLFKTPDKLKSFFKRLAESESGATSFLLGATFTVLKAPCIAGILLSLIFSVNQTGSFGIGKVVSALGLFSIGVLIPIVAVFVILHLGVSNKKINTFRVKARPFLRLISGLVIIATTVLAFF